MSKYKKLLKNVLTFALGSFGSRILQLLLLPYYTRALNTSQYGSIEIITQSINIIVPLICLSIYDGVMRFAMDKSINARQTLATAFRFIIATQAGLALLVLVVPPLHNIEHIWLIVLIVVAQSIRTLFAQYARAVGFVKQFSISGIIQTLVLAISNITLLSAFNLGVAGYLISLVIADFVSLFVLLLSTSIQKHVFGDKFNLPLLKSMLRFSVPLVPNAIMWWGMNASNRYFIRYYHGLSVTGLFGVASKVPAILTMLMMIFTQAWQLSAIEEYETSDSETYYSNIYSMLESFLFICGVALMIFIRLFWFAIGEGYQEALGLVPPILGGVVFSSLASFFGSLYLAAKRTKSILVTTIIGFLIGLVLNILLIPSLSGLGAGIATLVSFFLVNLYRIRDTSRFVSLRVNGWQLFANGTVLVLSSMVIYVEDLLLAGLVSVLSLIFVIYVNRNNLRRIIAKFSVLKKRV